MNIFPQDSRFYRCGTSDGTFNNVRYFTCPDNNGLFLSLASVAKQPDWLKLEYRPKRYVSTVSEGVQKDKTVADREVVKNHLRHQHQQVWRPIEALLTQINYLMEQECS